MYIEVISLRACTCTSWSIVQPVFISLILQHLDLLHHHLQTLYTLVYKVGHVLLLFYSQTTVAHIVYIVSLFENYIVCSVMLTAD